MKSIIIRLATTRDILPIMDLQIENHAQNVNEEQKKIDGFVTLLTSSRDLRACISQGLVYIAADADHEEDIVGYLILMRPFEANKIGFLRPLLEEVSCRISGTAFNDAVILKDWRNYLILAQILVRAQYSGKKIGTQLFNAGKKVTKELYPRYIITEVSSANPRSIAFHRSLGFSDSHSYSSVGQTFFVIHKRLS